MIKPPITILKGEEPELETGKSKNLTAPALLRGALDKHICLTTEFHVPIFEISFIKGPENKIEVRFGEGVEDKHPLDRVLLNIERAEAVFDSLIFLCLTQAGRSTDPSVYNPTHGPIRGKMLADYRFKSKEQMVGTLLLSFEITHYPKSNQRIRFRIPITQTASLREKLREKYPPNILTDIGENTFML